MDNKEIIETIIKQAKQMPCTVSELAKRIENALINANPKEPKALTVKKGVCPICKQYMNFTFEIGQMEYYECSECVSSVSYKNSMIIQIKFNKNLKLQRLEEESKWKI